MKKWMSGWVVGVVVLLAALVSNGQIKVKTCTSSGGGSVNYGYVSGGNGVIGALHSTGFQNIAFFQPFTTGANAAGYHPTTCSLYLGAKDASFPDFQCAIYNASGGNPTSKVCSTGDLIPGAVPGWQTASMPGTGCDLAASTNYYIAFNMRATGDDMYYDNSPTGAKDKSMAYGTWDDPVSGLSTDVGSASVYVTVTLK